MKAVNLFDLTIIQKNKYKRKITIDVDLKMVHKWDGNSFKNLHIITEFEVMDLIITNKYEGTDSIIIIISTLKTFDVG